MLHQPQPLQLLPHAPLADSPTSPLPHLHRLRVLTTPALRETNSLTIASPPNRRTLAEWSYGTKTPYLPPRLIQHIVTQSRSDHPAASARLIHVSLIARHGTRNPTKTSLQRMLSLYSWLRAALPSPQPLWLDRWEQTLKVYSQNPGDLTIHGEHELCNIGLRFAHIYGQTLHETTNKFRIRSSYKNRAIQSAKAFRMGYVQACQELGIPLPDTHEFEQESDSDSEPGTATPSVHSCPSTSSLPRSSDGDDRVEVLPIGRDASLRYFDPHHHNEYATFATQYKAEQRQNFSQSLVRHIAAEMANRISTTLGATIPLELDLVRVIGEVCAFETAHGRAGTSPFFRLLTPGDTRVLELADIRNRPFFKAHERFRAAAAPLVQDIMDSLTASVQPTETQAYAADLRFAHAETLVPLLLLLGIDTNGLSPTDPDFFRGLSAMSPFAANLAIELYEADSDSRPSHFVRFRLHERYVENIPALGEHGRDGVVELDRLLGFFREVLDEGMRNHAK